MTSKPNTPEAPCADHNEPAKAVDAAAAKAADTDSPQASTPAFRFPFSPAAYAPKQGDEQPWHQRNNKSNHDKRPGMAPKGTRRSMGKR